MTTDGVRPEIFSTVVSIIFSYIRPSILVNRNAMSTHRKSTWMLCLSTRSRKSVPFPGRMCPGRSRDRCLPSTSGRNRERGPGSRFPGSNTSTSFPPMFHPGDHHVHIRRPRPNLSRRGLEYILHSHSHSSSSQLK